MTRGTDRLDRMIAGTHEPSPCGAAMSLPVVRRHAAGQVHCEHTIDPRFLNANGVVFGGYLSAIVDDVSHHTAMTVLPDDKVCATSELSISYFRPCNPADGPVVLEGLLVNQSRRSYHIEVSVKRTDGKLIARAHLVHAISDRVQ